MRFRIDKLEVTCRKSSEIIDFADFNYFYGEMGAGKSTIARLIDYCLGGSIVMTPALQSEFVSSAVSLTVNDTPLQLARARSSDQVLATWGKKGAEEQVSLPARRPNGVVVPSTPVENVSDLVFWVAGYTPPKVRRSQIREDSELERLSFRDLWRFSYVDQDTIDSSFFNLGRDEEPFRRLKSRNVLRFVLGIHQESVAQLELELEETRRDRLKTEGAATVLSNALGEAHLSSSLDIASQLKDLSRRELELARQIASIRDDLSQEVSHASETLAGRARDLASELAAIDEALEQVSDAVDQDGRHLHEIEALATKVVRLEGARAVLSGVEFLKCPKCAQDLLERADGACRVCGQEDPSIEESEDEILVVSADIKVRKKELAEIIEARGEQLENLSGRRGDLASQKSSVDRELQHAMEAYDSAYLSRALALEQARAEAREEIKYLERMRVLPRKVDSLRDHADELAKRESTLRRQLKEARELAERDTSNLGVLTELFLDCLVRARIPGFSAVDVVTMESPWFLPAVLTKETGELATTAFSTLGSGGKKTLFKACFALAVHRLATKIDAVLPSFLLIDSPMKNTSERENRSQFEGFHQLLYELAAGELSATQFVLIDKEHCVPESGVEVDPFVRHMMVDDADNPPLISYYRD